MKHLRILSLVLCVTLAAVSCLQLPENDFCVPTAELNAVEVGDSYATLNCSLSNSSSIPTKVSFFMSEYKDMSSSKSFNASGGNGYYTAKVTGLKADCTYYYKAQATFANSQYDLTSGSFKTTFISVESISIDQNSVTLYVGERIHLTAAVSPSNASDKTVTWKSSDATVAIVSTTGVVTAKKAGAATITASAGGKTASCAVTVNISTPELVDLGLSVKWASWNLGASKPEESGRYFAWGDVVGQTLDGSKWSGGGFSTYPSYKLDSSNNLKPEYDAAHVALGDKWRMPTKAEFEELCGNCTYTWTSNYNGTGVAGRIFTSKKAGHTSKSIFLPAAGYGNGNYILNAGSEGNYWSGSLSRDNYACYLGFGTDYVSSSHTTHGYGMPVRSVYGDYSIPVSGVELSKTTASLKEGETLTLTATVTPGNATDKTVTWSTSDATVATVSATGVVTAKKAGSATITASAGGKTAECKVTVTTKVIAVTDIKLDKTTASLKEGETLALTATVSPSNATDKEVAWKSSDATVATVSTTGVVTAKKAGAATITASAGGKTASCAVTVNISTPELVDLGLSVKWASWNLGASKPEESGRYFAWGDVVGQTWNGSKWSGGGFSTYPSYKLDSSNNLKPEYDAAHVALGDKWRMPTKAECQELIDNCTYTWTGNYNGTGVAGRIFTSKKAGYTSKSIFLPAVGIGGGVSLDYAGSEGNYWSGSLSPDGYAWFLHFVSVSTVYTDVYGCVYGLSVRPVYGDYSIPVSGVELGKTTVSLTEGETLTLTATVTPSNATDKTVSWSTSDAAVAAVSATGVVTAKKEGTATITAKVGGKSATCTVYVSSSAIGDLSASATANCYIVSSPGTYKFNAKVKGNSYESVGNPASAVLLWESFGTSVAPSIGDIVRDVKLESGYVKFSTPAKLKNGNAVIAVKDVSGNILWSWHIWVCEGYDPDAKAQTYKNNAGKMMDRNLGATNATPGDVKAYGLYYQWGRKDPFPGPENITTTTGTAFSSSRKFQQSSASQSTGTISYVTSNPMIFLVASDSKNLDWYYTGSTTTDNTRWKSSKTVYDPCPAGWRVPDGGMNGVWAKALSSSDKKINGGAWDASNLGMNFGSGNTRSLGAYATIWYPASGWIELGAVFNKVGAQGFTWSCTPSASYQALAFSFYSPDGINLSYESARFRGMPVRCVKQ